MRLIDDGSECYFLDNRKPNALGPTGSVQHVDPVGEVCVRCSKADMAGRFMSTRPNKPNDPTCADSGAQVLPLAGATVPPSLRESSRHASSLPACCALGFCRPRPVLLPLAAPSAKGACGRPTYGCLSASQHLLHRSRSVRLASASEVTLCGEHFRYLPQRLALPM
jgi:hypothetical protein